MESTAYELLQLSQWIAAGILAGITVVVVVLAIVACLSPSKKERDRREEEELKTLENVVAFKARRGEVWRRK